MSTIMRITQLPPLPPRPSDGHKGTFGRVLIIAGSRGMSGAACLSGLSALRGGAGLVTVAAPVSAIPIIAGYEPSYLTRPLAENSSGQNSSGQISLSAIPELLELLHSADAAAIGPGLGQSSDLTELVTQIYQVADVPLVVDADALNALAHRRDLMTRTSGSAPRILTPHPGEFARLTGKSTADRESAASAFAAEHGVVLLLKGAGTIITDGQRLAINPTGNAGMATGGSGDVLTGLIAALLGQGLPPFDAAQLAAYLHGLAGDLAAAELSQPGLIASDLPQYLAMAWKRVGQ